MNDPKRGMGCAETRAPPCSETMSQGRARPRSSEVAEEVRNPRRAGASLTGGDAAVRSLRHSVGQDVRRVASAWVRGRGRRNAAARRRGPALTGLESADGFERPFIRDRSIGSTRHEGCEVLEVALAR
jgi:hypothetical protein